LGSPSRHRHHSGPGQGPRAGASKGGGRWLLSAEGADADALQALRSLSVLVMLLGRHLPGHVPPVMVLLTASVSQAAAGSEALQLQCLATWRVFLRCIEANAPTLLERVAVQATVLLLQLLQSTRDKVATAAAGVVTLLVVDYRAHVRRALSRMPPLPAEVPGLQRVRGVLQEELQLADARKRLQQLIDSLQHESLAVRQVALRELRSFLSGQRSLVADLMAR
ncbi:hypothetical protein Agub_g7702, partial [Astrephomene gubernaculifera]